MKNLLLVLFFAANAALAQSWPTKPVRVIVSYPPGGGADIITRLVAARLTEQLGQSFVVENRAGATGTIGAEAVINAAPDGYTVLSGANPEFTLMPHVLGKPGYEPVRDLAPLVLSAYAPAVIVAHPSLGAATLGDAVELSRKTPGGLAYGTPGRGTPNHLAMELLAQQARAAFIHIPYKGGGPAVTDVLSGVVPLAVINTPPLMAHLRAGKLKPLATFHAQRSRVLPDVPTVKEAIGLERATASAWFAFFAPANTPRGILSRLESEIRKALADPGIGARLADSGLEVAALPSEKLAELMRAESSFHAQVLKQFNIKPD